MRICVEIENKISRLHASSGISYRKIMIILSAIEVRWFE